MTRTSGSEQKAGVLGAGARIVALGATTLALAVVAAGCGGSGGGEADAAGGSADTREQFREAALKYAKCMRGEGIDMPDPQFEGGGGVMRLGGPSGGVDPGAPGFEEAEEKCRKHLEAVDPPEISEERQDEFQQAALDFARCMRGEGIDMPDPQFDGGRVTMRAGPGGGLDRDDSAFQEAFETCQDELPEGRGGPGAPAPAP